MHIFIFKNTETTESTKIDIISKIIAEKVSETTREAPN